MIPALVAFALVLAPPFVSDHERDLLVRTVIGEALNQPDTGQIAVAHVVINRVNRGGYGGTVRDVVLRPKAFEPWSTRARRLMAYAETDPAYQRAAAHVDAALAGAPDPTRGATHFANVRTVKARKNKRAMRWLVAMAAPVKIGAHTFGQADGRL